MSYYDDYEIPPLPDPPSYQDDLSQQDFHQQAQQEAQHETLSVQDRESGQTPDLALDQSVDQSFLETYEPDQFTSRLTYLPRDEQDHVVGNDNNEWTQVRTNPTDEHIQNVISGWNDDRFDSLDNLPPPTDDVTQDLSQLIYDTQAAEIDIHALQSPQNDLLPEHTHEPEQDLHSVHEDHITAIHDTFEAAERIATEQVDRIHESERDLQPIREEHISLFHDPFEEAERIAVEETDRIADIEREDAERIAVEETDRIADIEREDAERIAVEETDRIADIEREDAERIAVEETDRIADIEREDAERIAVEETDRIADIEGEDAERIAVEETDRIADIEREDAERIAVEETDRIADIEGEDAERIAVEETDRIADIEREDAERIAEEFKRMHVKAIDSIANIRGENALRDGSEAVGAAAARLAARTPRATVNDLQCILRAADAIGPDAQRIQDAIRRIRSGERLSREEMAALEEVVRRVDQAAAASRTPARGEEVFSEISEELALDAPGTTRLATTGDAAREARAAGFIGPEGTSGVVDVGVHTHSSAPEVRRALGVTGAGQQSAHLDPTSILRSVEGYSRGRALTTLLPPDVHKSFDDIWKTWAKEQRRAGETHATVGDVFDKMKEAVLASDMPDRSKGPIIDSIRKELISDMGLSLGDRLPLPYPNVRPTQP